MPSRYIACSVIAIGSVPAMSVAVLALNGKVVSTSHKQRLVVVQITATKNIVLVKMREEDENLAEDNDVLLRKDGTLEHLPCFETLSTTSTGFEAEDAAVTEISTLAACFAEAQAQRCRAGGFNVGDEQREIFSDMGLTYEKVKTVQGTFADMSESVDSEDEYVKWCDTRDTVLENTGGACSLAYSGPTSASVDKTVIKQLVFSCGDPTCPCQGKKMFTLSHLMPTKVGTMKKDLCYDAFQKQMRESFPEADALTKKAFQVGVATMRAGEKSAAKVLAAWFLFVSLLV